MRKPLTSAPIDASCQAATPPLAASLIGSVVLLACTTETVKAAFAATFSTGFSTGLSCGFSAGFTAGFDAAAMGLLGSAALTPYKPIPRPMQVTRKVVMRPTARGWV